MKDLIINQIRLYKKGLVGIYTLLLSSMKLFFSDLRQYQIRKKAYSHLLKKIIKNKEVTRYLEETMFDPNSIRISFIASIRRVGNPNSKIHKFLDSIVESARNIEKIEVLLMIDEDDDIEYFIKIKKIYGSRLTLKIYISPIRYGYEKLHLYDKILLTKVAKSSLMICDYSDDCIITLKDFDKRLLEIDAKYKDGVYFIHTRAEKYTKFLGDVSDNLLKLYWAMQAISPQSYFPIISKKAIEVMNDASNQLEDCDRREWAPYANAYICDCYVDVISTMLKKRGVDRVEYLEMVQINTRNVYVDYQHNRDMNGLTSANRAMLKLLSLETQDHLERIADLLNNHVNSSFESETHSTKLY